MEKFKHYHKDENGIVTVKEYEITVPDLLGRIQMKESEITDRRRDEAQTDDAGGSQIGRAWLKEKRLEISELREAMNELLRKV